VQHYNVHKVVFTLKGLAWCNMRCWYQAFCLRWNRPSGSHPAATAAASIKKRDLGGLNAEFWALESRLSQGCKICLCYEFILNDFNCIICSYLKSIWYSCRCEIISLFGAILDTLTKQLMVLKKADTERSLWWIVSIQRECHIRAVR
jgi:hypothetical protein